jgi:uncharacterized protein (TIGR03435 family)
MRWSWRDLMANSARRCQPRHSTARRSSQREIAASRSHPLNRKAAALSVPCNRGQAPSRSGGAQLADFARVLSFLGVLGRPVVDRTGLTADYEFELRWTPDVDRSRPVDPDMPSLFTAIREQLGLKLEPTNGPVEVLIIDSTKLPEPD